MQNLLDAPDQLEISMDDIHNKLMGLNEGKQIVFSKNGLSFTASAFFDEEINGDKYYTYNVIDPKGNTYTNLYFYQALKLLNRLFDFENN
jgi:hypothetical protein